jgi:glyoxylase-like metal-dependent hydrolase (beta-lactamase superfamily II)
MSDKIQYRKNVFTRFFTVAPGVWGLKNVFVNIYMILNHFDGNWVLVDAGLKRSSSKIKKMACQIFGGDAKPSAIILTHGHFDHVGSLHELAVEWNTPVFAHYLEIPYITGKSSYPPPDPTVGGGLISYLAWTYPTHPINICNYANILPENGRVPGLPEWKYLHTPGHSPGHISLFRESDGVLIAGDAFVTTTTESVFSVLLQTKKISGPPKYLTYDWALAKESVKSLMNLEPEVVASGHGRPMKGSVVRKCLHNLSDHFYSVATPSTGRYIDEPAVTNATGVVYVPPNNINAQSVMIKILGVTAITTIAYLLLLTRKKKKVKLEQILAYETW